MMDYARAARLESFDCEVPRHLRGSG